MNEPAFPHVAENWSDIKKQGISIRDYFAAKAMVGLMAMERAQQYVDEDGFEMNYDKEGDIGTLFVHTDHLTDEAYMIADMMLKSRGK